MATPGPRPPLEAGAGLIHTEELAATADPCCWGVHLPESVVSVPGQQAAGRILGPLREFLQAEASGGLVLLGATVVALVWANSPFTDSYNDLWHTPP